MVALAAGLAWEDREVIAGTRYEYSVRRSTPETDPAAELARLAVTVGQDPALPAPTGLVAEQTGVGRVELRWDRPAAAAGPGSWVVGWNLTRTGPGGEVRLNKRPLVVLDRRQDGSLVEPVSYFLDGRAPVGRTTYSLAAVDLFGRESRRAQATVAVGDWRTPDPVPAAEAGQDGASSGSRIRRGPRSGTGSSGSTPSGRPSRCCSPGPPSPATRSPRRPRSRPGCSG
jgi:hypothetical protein